MLKAIKSGNGWTGLLIGAFFSLLGGFAVYFLTLSNKEPIYSKKSVNYISDFTSQISDLSVFYKGKKVKNLTRTNLIFANFGKSTIYRNDIAQKDKLRIISSIPGVNILNVKKIYEKRPVSSIELSVNPNNSNEYFVKFDFLDKEDGFVAQVVHDGVSDESIQVVGTIIGSEKIKQSLILKRKVSIFENPNDILSLLGISMLAFFIILNYFLSKNNYSNREEKLISSLRSLSLEENKLILDQYEEKLNKINTKNKKFDRNMIILFLIFVPILIILTLPFSRNLLIASFSKLLPVGYELFLN